MIQVTFASQGSRLTGFTVEGHSGLAPFGEDILCAAVTSAVRLTECALNDVLGLEAPVKLREEDAYLSIKLPGGLSESGEEICQTLLTALMVYFSSLQEEHPDNLIVLDMEV